MPRLVGLLALRIFALVLLLTLAPASRASDKAENPRPGEPASEKARKAFASAVDWQKAHQDRSAIDSYRKANQQDDGHCTACLRRAYDLAIKIGDHKDAEQIAHDMIVQASSEEEKAIAHYRLASALQREGLDNRKAKCFADSCLEMRAALDARPDLAIAHYSPGVSLAHLNQDDEARREFGTFLSLDKSNPDPRERATRYAGNIELARARMAPPFSLDTLDGQHISLDGLAGKVVLIDFWATWCGPCREALPHIQKIAKKFEGQPLVVISISLDKDDAKWRDFVSKNGMTWLQYRDGYFTGPIATRFGVTAIPSTFTIEADGVLEDQHVGDASIEGKIKKLVARAAEAPAPKPVETASEKSAPASQ